MAKKIQNADLERLAIEQKLGCTAIAKQLGCSKSAVSKRMKALGMMISKKVALYHAGDLVERKINMVDQLQKINDNANELLDLLMAWNRGDETALQILESQVSTKKVRIGQVEELVKEYKFKDPRELALKAMQEIRGQLNLQLDIFKALYDLESIAEFQKEVITIIGEVAPDVRQRIIEALKENRAIRSATDFS